MVAQTTTCHRYTFLKSYLPIDGANENGFGMVLPVMAKARPSIGHEGYVAIMTRNKQTLSLTQVASEERESWMMS